MEAPQLSHAGRELVRMNKRCRWQGRLPKEDKREATILADQEDRGRSG